jgi:O-antigen ligase
MSTVAASPAGFGAAPKTKVAQRPADSSIFPLVLTYALVLVLIYLAVRGAFSFELAPDTGSAESTAGGTFQKVTLVIAFGIMLTVMLPVCKSLWKLVKQYPVLFVLPLWGTLSTAWSLYPIRTFPTGLMILILTLFGFYIPVRFTPRQQMQLFVFAGMMTTMLSYLTIVVLPRAGVDHKNSTTGLQGIFPQKNVCAVITIELLTVGFCYAFRGKNAPIKRIAFITLLTLLILGTMARTGWILLILVVGFIALLKGLHRLRPLERFTVTWFLPAASVVVIWLIAQYSAPILHLLGKGATLSGRTGVWQVVFLAIVKRPILGFGYGAFWVAGNPEASRLGQIIGDPGLNNAENGVLQIWLELGIIGVAMLFAMLFRTTKNAIACFRSNTPNYAIWYMSILFITLLALIDGSKFMLWGSIDWMMYIMADIGLATEARRVKALQAA